jgi:dsDNA-specific endonuclease/ATPase MutS2
MSAGKYRTRELTVGSWRLAGENARVNEDEPVEIPITDTFDLHPFRPGEIGDVALEYLTEAHARGFRQVRLIHGRGIGVQRERIRALLQTLDFVEAYQDADGSGGGWGATVVLLK